MTHEAHIETEIRRLAGTLPMDVWGSRSYSLLLKGIRQQQQDQSAELLTGLVQSLGQKLTNNRRAFQALAGQAVEAGPKAAVSQKLLAETFQMWDELLPDIARNAREGGDWKAITERAERVCRLAAAVHAYGKRNKPAPAQPVKKVPFVAFAPRTGSWAAARMLVAS